MQDEGKVRHVGLSEVSVDELTEAERITPIVSVQNRYNLTYRRSEPLLRHCEQRGIAFIPWLPIAPSIRSAATTDVVAEVAHRLGVTRPQVAPAWLLHHSPVMVPIPGTSSRHHLAKNLAAADLVLSEEDYGSLDAIDRVSR
ncbi:aldo/keto reductase [Actinokineospora sp.]|uniref:aldo/keto reductase n=1 Tax=Actinokineospora sp. TaxID=1872133 RepID=UPI00403766FE